MPDTPTKPWYLREFLGRTMAFTIIELLLVMALLVTLAAITTPMYIGYNRDFRIRLLIVELHTIVTMIERYEKNNGDLPQSLDELAQDLNQEIHDDPWGTPYQYLKIRGVVNNQGKVVLPSGYRKDRHAHPLNTDFDLFSMGPNGEWQPSLTATVSHDDIVRANDGGYIGVASEF